MENEKSASGMAKKGYTRCCFNCSQLPAMACARCRLDFYCGKRCQTSDWPRHKIFCRDKGEPNAIEEPMPGREVKEVNDLCRSEPSEHLAEKKDTLKNVQEYGVRRLFPVYCHDDPRWTLKLLEAASPLVEDLDLWNAGREHWLLLPKMPRLLHLEVNYEYARIIPSPFNPRVVSSLLPCLPEPTQPGRLLWLRACLPIKQLVSLVRCYRTTLRELQLFVGTSGNPNSADFAAKLENRGWPFNSDAEELALVLSKCELTKLRRLVLRRPHAPVFSISGEFTHRPQHCRVQMEAVRRVLPDVKHVLCGTCDDIRWTCFEDTIFGMF